MAETLQKRNSPLIVECDAEVIAIDYDLMKSLHINLVDNSSKASKPGHGYTMMAGIEVYWKNYEIWELNNLENE